MIPGPDGADHDDRRKKSHIQLSRGQLKLSGKLGRLTNLTNFVHGGNRPPQKKHQKTSGGSDRNL